MTERPIPTESNQEEEPQAYPTTPLFMFFFKSVEEIENEQEGDPPNSDELWFSLAINPLEGWEGNYGQ